MFELAIVQEARLILQQFHCMFQSLHDCGFETVTPCQEQRISNIKTRTLLAFGVFAALPPAMPDTFQSDRPRYATAKTHSLVRMQSLLLVSQRGRSLEREAAETEKAG